MDLLLKGSGVGLNDVWTQQSESKWCIKFSKINATNYAIFSFFFVNETNEKISMILRNSRL